ncbi:MAG: hypothetical protein PHR78_02125 [Eubacteriales bacterium]|nr:hypothetical protein [Eubacteriales bacterium]MDD4540950.1 hypothetical protein [Eubacteriales bacterium]
MVAVVLLLVLVTVVLVELSVVSILVELASLLVLLETLPELAGIVSELVDTEGSVKGSVGAGGAIEQAVIAKNSKSAISVDASLIGPSPFLELFHIFIIETCYYR